jgi:hypothetical protein
LSDSKLVVDNCSSLIDDQASYQRKMKRTNKVLWFVVGGLGAAILTETLLLATR